MHLAWLKLEITNFKHFFGSKIVFRITVQSFILFLMCITGSNTLFPDPGKRHPLRKLKEVWSGTPTTNNFEAFYKQLCKHL